MKKNKIAKRTTGLEKIFNPPGTLPAKSEKTSPLSSSKDKLSPPTKREGAFALSSTTQFLPLRLLILFDNTGSMSELCDELKSKIKSIVEEVLEFESQAQICVIAYKDFEDSPWQAKSSGFSSSAEYLSSFLQQFPSENGHGGGNGGEAMEYAFYLANQELANIRGNIVMVVAGDQVPNGYANSSDYGYDWKREVRELKLCQVTIHTVGVHGWEWDEDSENFFKMLARENGGQFFSLDNMDNLVRIILGMTAKSTGRQQLADFYLSGGGSLKKLPLERRKALIDPSKKYGGKR